MREAHHSWFTVHPGETKMYHDLEAPILVAWDEERRSEFRLQVFDVPTSES